MVVTTPGYSYEEPANPLPVRPVVTTTTPPPPPPTTPLALYGAPARTGRRGRNFRRGPRRWTLSRGWGQAWLMVITGPGNKAGESVVETGVVWSSSNRPGGRSLRLWRKEWKIEILCRELNQARLLVLHFKDWLTDASRAMWSIRIIDTCLPEYLHKLSTLMTSAISDDNDKMTNYWYSNLQGHVYVYCNKIADFKTWRLSS